MQIFGGLVPGCIKTKFCKKNQEDMRLTAFSKLYKMCTLLHRTPNQAVLPLGLFRAVRLRGARGGELVAQLRRRELRRLLPEFAAPCVLCCCYFLLEFVL